VFVKMELIEKPPGLDEIEFRQRCEVGGADVKTRMPSVRKCHLNIVTDRKQRGIEYLRGNVDFGAIGEYWFDDLSSIPFNFGSPSVTALQNIVIPVPLETPHIKRMSTLKRHAGVSAERFKTEWFELHAALVKRIPGVAGYTQNLIIDRSRADGTPASYEELPIDGFVELWFADQAGLDAAFATGQAKTLMTHAQEFIGEISTFLVEPIEFN
jgi:uncharacterized protein (TIGR02118 family)